MIHLCLQLTKFCLEFEFKEWIETTSPAQMFKELSALPKGVSLILCFKITQNKKDEFHMIKYRNTKTYKR